jgi:hypothetical protein
MNINKAFREGQLNSWLYGAINKKLDIEHKGFSIKTAILLISLNIIFMELIVSSSSSFYKLVVLISVFTIGVLCINIVLRICYYIKFSREYEKFYEITCDGLDTIENFSEFLDQAQYSSELVKKGLALNVLARYFSYMLQLENKLGERYQEFPEWAQARQNFSKAYDLYRDYDLALTGGWSPYKKKAEELLAQK